MAFKVTKTYPHELGLSASFRQWRAQSHCRFIHGYPLSFKYVFAAQVLDQNNWVLDFGGLKEVKAHLCEDYDHRYVLAKDDPQFERLFQLGQDLGEAYGCMNDDCITPKVADVLVMDFVGCEGFAYREFQWADAWLKRTHADAVRDRYLHLYSVEVREHGGNSAIYEAY